MPRRPVKSSGTSGRYVDRKTIQLCHQVAEELQMILISECDDDFLRELTVESVIPAPNASRLLVSVSSPSISTCEELGSILYQLQLVMGLLRSEVARAITRRKAPELIFRVVTPGVESTN